MAYKFAVIERYPDGSKWVHYFDTRSAAQVAIDEVSKPQLGRTYELVEHG